MSLFENKEAKTTNKKKVIMIFFKGIIKKVVAI
jgi:hypothetical protein